MSKTRQKLDAVKTAKSIHDGDYSSLRGKSFLVCDSIEDNKGRDTNVKKPNDAKMTLTKLAEKIENLGNDLRNEMDTGFKQVNLRIDNLEKDFNKKIDQINTRLDRVEKRLDYNGLKDIPNG